VPSSGRASGHSGRCGVGATNSNIRSSRMTMPPPMRPMRRLSLPARSLTQPGRFFRSSGCSNRQRFPYRARQNLRDLRIVAASLPAPAIGRGWSPRRTQPVATQPCDSAPQPRASHVSRRGGPTTQAAVRSRSGSSPLPATAIRLLIRRSSPIGGLCMVESSRFPGPVTLGPGHSKGRRCRRCDRHRRPIGASCHDHRRTDRLPSQ